MLVRSSTSGLTVLTPAKLNLFLEVLSKRPDGFHEIETLMIHVGVYDTLTFREEAGVSISLESIRVSASRPVADAEPERPPEGTGNIVVRAVNSFRQATGVRRGARLTLTKRIPIAAGLGGGSSDAAAALVAANIGWRVGWPRHELAKLAAELGSDVPFFLNRGPAVCRGRGETIEPVTGIGCPYFVIAHPPSGLSTADVYRACRPAAQPDSVAPMLAALRRGCPREIGRALRNRLQEPAESLSPWIARLREEFERTDVCGHQMSGSGTSYFAICRNAGHARRMASLLRNRGLQKVYAAAGCR